MPKCHTKSEAQFVILQEGDEGEGVEGEGLEGEEVEGEGGEEEAMEEGKLSRETSQSTFDFTIHLVP